MIGRWGGQEEGGRGGALFISGNYFVSLKYTNRLLHSISFNIFYFYAGNVFLRVTSALWDQDRKEELFTFLESLRLMSVYFETTLL